MVFLLDTNKDTNLKLIPRPHQIEMSEWLKKMRRCWVTDHPGVGKTLESAEAAELPCMIVAPSHLVGQWGDFLKNQYPETKVSVCVGTRKNREKELRLKSDWYVVNYEMLAIYSLPVGMKTFIFDESHHLRNRRANKCKAANKLVRREKGCRVYMLSASPMWKSIDDIWMQGHILYPQIFNSYYEFVRAFCITDDTPYGPKVIGIKKDMRDEFYDIIRPIMWGRSMKDVGRYLPDKVESIITIDLPPDLRKLYNTLKQNYMVEVGDKSDQWLMFNGPAIAHALRQITASKGKIDAIREIVEDNNRPSVICFWYRDHAKKMFDTLEKGSAVLLDGNMDAALRQREAVKAQNTGKHIVCTQASLTEGVNLSAYRQVIIGEQNYTPGSNYQFLARVVRDRNDNGEDMEPVLVYYVHMKRTIDEAIYRVSRRREASIKDVIRESLV